MNVNTSISKLIKNKDQDNIKILTTSGNLLDFDELFYLRNDDLICLLDTEGYSSDELDDFCYSTSFYCMSLSNVDLLRAVLEVEWGGPTKTLFNPEWISNIIYRLPWDYELLSDDPTLEDLGEYVFENYWDTRKYDDIRPYINFEAIGRDFEDDGSAIKTDFGFLVFRD